MQARIFLDYSFVKQIKSESTKVAAECICNNNAKLMQQFWTGGGSSTSATSIIVKCANKAALCIIPERGGPWVPTRDPPEYLRLYPYCEAEYAHWFPDHGWLGSELVQSGGTPINEARYYKRRASVAGPDRPFEMQHKPRGYTSGAYIKATAISCGGCQSVRNYASFTCPMSPANG